METEEKPFVCSLCSNSFGEAEILEKHIENCQFLNEGVEKVTSNSIHETDKIYRNLNDFYKNHVKKVENKSVKRKKEKKTRNSSNSSLICQICAKNFKTPSKWVFLSW